MPIRYKLLGGDNAGDYLWEGSLDLILSPGCYAVEIEHTDANVGLPFDFCGQEHYIVGTLIVTDNGTKGKVQKNRLTGQLLVVTSQNSLETNINIRTRFNDEWSGWRSFVYAGAYDKISTTDELLATVTDLVNRTEVNKIDLTIERQRATLSEAVLQYRDVSIEYAGNDADSVLKDALKLLRIETDNPDLNTVGFRVTQLYKENNGDNRFCVTTSLGQVVTVTGNAIFDGTVHSKSFVEKIGDIQYSYTLYFQIDGSKIQKEGLLLSNGYDSSPYIVSKSAVLYIGGAVVSIQRSCNNNDIILLEQGGINLATGDVHKGTDDTIRVRTKGYFKAPLQYELNDGYQILGFIKYRLLDGVYSHVMTNYGEFDGVYEDGFYYKFSVKRTDGAEISVADDIFNVLRCGTQALVSENNIRSIDNENEIKELQSEVAQMSDMFESISLQGHKLASYELNGIQKLSDGNVGLPVETRSNLGTKTYKLMPAYKNVYNYAVAAAVFTDVDNLSMVGDDATYPVSFLFNHNANIYAGSSNIITKGVVMVDDRTVLVYQVSGRIAEKNNELPNTAYVRLAVNSTQKFGVSKMLVLEVEEWNDSYVDVLVGNIDNPTVWIETDELGVIKNETVLRRDLSSGIAFWGSSSTEGAWVKTVADSLNMPYYWGGVGGENIWAIMGRMGVLPLRIPTPFTIPASKDVPVQIPESYNLKVRWDGSYKSATVWVSSTASLDKLLVNPCYIAGVKGNLIGSGSSNGVEPLQFQRLEDGDAVTTKAYEPIYTLGFRETRDCVWFLACHFNGGYSSTEELVELYKKMYDVSCSKKVIILGRHKTANGVVTSPTLETLQEQEVALEDEFGLMFFNTREYMCGKGFERFKALYPNDYTDNDVALASQGVPPDCMYESASNVHFNSKGYTVLTEAITQRLIELGYNLFRYGGDMGHLGCRIIDL